MSEPKRKACYITLGDGVRLAAETNASIYSRTRVRFDEKIALGARIYTRKEVALISTNLIMCDIILGIDKLPADTVLEFVGITHDEPHPFLGRFRQPKVPGHFDPALRLVDTYVGKVSELKEAATKYREILI